MTSRFFCPQADLSGRPFDLPAPVLHHVERVLRLGEGDALVLFDGRGLEASATLVRGPRGLQARVAETREVDRESVLQVTLAQCLPASDKMDWVVQKAVELGVSRILPVASRRCVLKLGGDRAERRLEHWQQVAIAACEQCGRNRVPEIAAIQGLERLFADGSAEALGDRFILAPGAVQGLGQASAGGSRLSVLIGPEGGFDPEELRAADAAGWRRVSLGPRVLRTETAGLAALAALQAWAGEF